MSAACSDSARRIGIGSSASRSIPGIQPTVEIAVRRWVIPRSGRRSAGASTLSRFIIGSPMPMNTQWSTSADPAEVERLVEDLRRGQVAPELHLPGGAERAGQRAARLRGEAERAPAVAVAHQHRLDRPPVVRCANSALTVPSLACASCSTRQRRERHRARPARRAGSRGRSDIVVERRRRRAPSSATPGRRGSAAHRARRAFVRAGPDPR